MKKIQLAIFCFLLFNPLHSQPKSESQKLKIDHLSINPQDFVPENVNIETIAYANVTSDLFKDVIVAGELYDTSLSYGERTGYAAIISYHLKDQKWKVIYDRIKAYTYFRVIIGKVFSDRANDIVIFFDWHGNGRFMDYIVTGYLKNKIQILLEKSDIYRGDLEIQDNQIIQYEGFQATAYKWDGISLKGTPLSKTPLKFYSPGDKVIEFSIDDQENVSISDKEVTLRVGEKFHLVRTNHGVPENVFGTSDGVLSDSGWIAQKSGITFIKIVPWGTNYEKEARIKINVVDTTKSKSENR